MYVYIHNITHFIHRDRQSHQCLAMSNGGYIN